MSGARSRQFHVVAEWLAAGVHLQDLVPAFEVGRFDRDLPVEPARTRCRVEDVRLVYAMRITLVLMSKSSISTSNWFSVTTPRRDRPKPAPRWRPTASISSTKTMAGAFSLASLNRSRTREAPTPTNISTKSEPEIGTAPGLAGDGPGQQRLAGARGAVQQDTLGDLRAHGLELGRFLQELLDLLEFLDRFLDAGDIGERGLGSVSLCSFARDLPKFMTWLPPPCIWVMKNQISPASRRNGSNAPSRLQNTLAWGTSTS